MVSQLEENTKAVAQIAALKLSKEVSVDLAEVLSTDLSELLQIECSIPAEDVAQGVYWIYQQFIVNRLPGILTSGHGGE